MARDNDDDDYDDDDDDDDGFYNFVNAITCWLSIISRVKKGRGAASDSN